MSVFNAKSDGLNLGITRSGSQDPPCCRDMNLGPTGPRLPVIFQRFDTVGWMTGMAFVCNECLVDRLHRVSSLQDVWGTRFAL